VGRGRLGLGPILIVMAQCSGPPTGAVQSNVAADAEGCSTSHELNLSDETVDTRTMAIRLNVERRQSALDRFERAVEVPLLVLALAMLPLLVLPLLVDLSPSVEDAFVAADWLIWAVFAFEYATRLILTPARARFIRRNWTDLLIIVLPFLRPLRVVRSARALRVLRLARLVAVLGKVSRETRRLFLRHRLHYAVLATMTVVVGCAALALAVEGDAGNIKTFGDALWWAVTTITTVGYGDRYPVTAAGRGIAALLMVTGIAFFGVLTANVAAFFLERDEETEEQDDDRLDEILRRLAAIEESLRNQRAA
jgi:voltage-gated potassium channel